MKSFSASEAKNNFRAVIEAAAVEPVEIQKSGKPVAVMVPPSQFVEMWRSYIAHRVRERIAGKDQQTLNVLQGYSDGKLGLQDVRDLLGLAHDGEVLDALGLAGLPMPMLAPELIEDMVQGALETVRRGQ